MKKKINKIELWDAEHPLRQMSIRIIEEVIEPLFMSKDMEEIKEMIDNGLENEVYYKTEDDLVALLSNLEK